MTYEEAISYLESTSTFGIKPGLTRIQSILDALDNPERAYKIIHVTGTNGKGSTAAYISYALFMSGLKVGRFTSPHLESYTERIMINDTMISEEAFADALDNVRDVVNTLTKKGMEYPTQFELLTATAFLYFKMQTVEYAVIEVGLGGLLDSTNVVLPEVSVITNVTIDHTAYCGTTVEEIAKHKAGIIKAGVPVVTAAQSSALDIIENTAQEKHAPLYVYNKAFSIDSRSAITVGDTKGQMVTISDEGGNPAMLFTKLCGIHQAVNLSCALMVVRLLMTKESKISEETMREGFARTEWPGRFEILSVDGRTFILDGAHNAAGSEAFEMTYKELFQNKPKTLIMAIMKDKEIPQIISQVVKEGDRVFTVAAQSQLERSETPKDLANRIGDNATPISSVSSALEEAIRETNTGDIVAICGSLYILGEVRRWLRQKAIG